MRLMLHYVALRLVASRYVASRCIVLRRLVSRYVASRCVVSPFVASRFITSRFVASCYVTLRFVAPRYVALRFVASRNVASRYIVPRCDLPRPAAVAFCATWRFVFSSSPSIIRCRPDCCCCRRCRRRGRPPSPAPRLLPVFFDSDSSNLAVVIPHSFLRFHAAFFFLRQYSGRCGKDCVIDCPSISIVTPVRAVPLVVELPTLILFQDNQTLNYGALPLFSRANYRESGFCR